MPGPIACRLQSQQNPVYEHALAELGAAADSELGALSHCVAQAAATRLRSQVEQPKPWKDHGRDELAAKLRRARSCCLAEIHTLCDPETPQIEALLTNDLYLERLSHLALEHLLVNRAAPPLLHFPHPENGLEGTTSATMVGILFDFPLGITQELFPLWTDAFAFGVEAGNRIEVAGIHISWLNEDMRATRTITFDARRDAFLEAPTEHPIRFHGAVLVNQSRDTHADLSQRLQDAGLPHVNPGALADLADDKWACYRRWQEASVPTPETVLLPADGRSAAVEDIAAELIAGEPALEGPSRQWVVQPRRGTEGRGVHLIQPDSCTLAQVLCAWREIASSDDAILRPRVGNLEWRRDAGEDWHPLELRLHVTCGGETCAAESGYLARSRFDATSSDWHPPPIADLEQLQLAATADSHNHRHRIHFGADELQQIGGVAADAIRSLGPLPLAGVDVALTWGISAVEASVLDVNPRPAGLMRANLLADSGAAGIGRGLWRYLSDRIDRAGPK